MHEAAEPISLLTARVALEQAGELEAIGGDTRLALLVEAAAIEAHVESYARRVLQLAGLRQIRAAAELVGERAMDGHTPAEIATEAGELFARIAERTDGEAMQQRGGRIDAQPLGRVLRALYDTLDTPETDFVRCPIPQVDQRLGGGLLREEVLTLGGRPGVAKSALMLQWAAHAASQGQRVLIVSCEMGALALGRRVIAQEARIAATRLRRRELEDPDWQKLALAVGRLAELPVWIDDSASTLAAIRRLVRGHGYRLVIVDYLQLVRDPQVRERRLEVSAISAGLKRLARRERCSVIALSSLTRLGKERGKREPPTMDKLKESGDIEHDSDVVLILDWPDTTQSERTLIVAKARDGESGGTPITIDFDPTFVRFVVREAGEEEVPW